MLATQGGFAEHVQALQRQSNVEAVEVRTSFELGAVDALILPGGESTAIGMGLVDANMLDDVKDFVKTKPTWGICAGLILLANELDEGAKQPLIGGLDINVKRNAFGRQSKTAFRTMETANAAKECGDGSWFVRAPAVTRVGDDVEVLASVPGDDVAELPDEGAVVAVKQGNLMGTCFHPEISSDDSWLRLFLNDMCGAESEALEPEPRRGGGGAVVRDQSQDGGREGLRLHRCQARVRRLPEGRRHHGRCRRRAGAHRRGCRRGRGHGPRAHPRRHQGRRRRRPCPTPR